MDTSGDMPICYREMAMQDENRRQSVRRDQLRNENGRIDLDYLEYLHHSVYDDRLRSGIPWAGMCTEPSELAMYLLA